MASRKLYIALAAKLREAEPPTDAPRIPGVDRHSSTALAINEFRKGMHGQWVLDVRKVAHALADDNPRFDYDRFYAACGLH